MPDRSQTGDGIPFFLCSAILCEGVTCTCLTMSCMQRPESCMVVGHCIAVAVHAVLHACIYLPAFRDWRAQCITLQHKAIQHLSGLCTSCSVFLWKLNDTNVDLIVDSIVDLGLCIYILRGGGRCNTCQANSPGGFGPGPCVS